MQTQINSIESMLEKTVHQAPDIVAERSSELVAKKASQVVAEIELEPHSSPTIAEVRE